MNQRWLIRGGITAVLFFVFLLHIKGLLSFQLLNQLESFAYDARVNLTAPGTLDDRVVIVDIDEASVQAEGQWPWPRDRLALMIDHLFDRYGVRAVGFDITFPEPELNPGTDVLDRLAREQLVDDPEFQAAYREVRPGLEHDRLFAEAIKGRAVVLGYVFHPEIKGVEPQRLGQLPEPLIPEEDIEGQLDFHQAGGYSANLPILQSQVRRGGFFDNPLVSSDGSFRRTPTLQQYNGDLYGSLSLELLRAATGWPAVQFAFQPGAARKDYLHLEYLEVGDFRIPVDADLAVLVPYRGPVYSFPYVPAAEVIAGEKKFPELDDAIVLIGTSAAGLFDLRVTPVGERFNGVEVHANVVSGILDGRVKHHPEFVNGAHITLLLLIGVVLTVVASRLSVVPATVFMLLLVGGIVGSNLYVWNDFNYVVPLASPLFFTFLLFVLHILYGFLVESRGKRQLSSLFGTYIPPELVEEMSEDPSSFSLEGESREMTVLFSDVRGFTTISESLKPNELTALMNEFLTPLTRIIHEQRGTIDKYMGDAVMAFWGAPLPDQDHASHAVAAALAMVEEMKKLQPQFKKKGWPPLQIGVGLNTGEMNVGNMGSEFRMAYTVLGDAGLTKQYGVDILVSEFTRESAPEFAFIELDRVRVKGKQEPVAIFEPLGRRDALPKEARSLRTQHKQALLYYRQQNWDAAEREFFSLSQAQPERRIYAIYLQRIAHFRQTPPGQDWDGVFDHTSK